MLNILRPVSGSPAAKVNEMFTVFSDLRDPSVSGFPAARTKLSVSFTGAEPFALVFHSFLGKSLQVFPRIGKKVCQECPPFPDLEVWFLKIEERGNPRKIERVQKS